MKITFIGTGTSQGIPVIGCKCNVCLSTNTKDKRLRTSIVLETADKVVVIDTGPDFRQQMLSAKVDKLDAVVFTHEHKDHVAGFDDIRAYNFILKRRMDVYATENVQKALQREFPYIFNDFKYPGIPEINLHTITSLQSFHIGSMELLPFEVMHYNLPVLGFKIADFTYITDANFIPDSSKEKIYGSKILVLNALRREPHISHFNLKQALALIDELKPEKAYLIHISHQLGLHAQVQKELPAYVDVAYDGLIINQ